MKYDVSIEKSAEYLRQAVQHMTKQAAALHPISYAVWYEYAAGLNAALKSAIDKQTLDGEVLDEHSTHALFSKHIAEIDEATAAKVTIGFQKVMTDISKSAAMAGDEADRFGTALEQWSDDAVSSQISGIENLLEHTRSMQTSIGSLKSQLMESNREIEVLRNEVKSAREEALSDGLTGLVNRKGFDLALAACLNEAYADTLGPSLLVTDIDFFKRVNDTYGHLFGDKVIRAVAQILKDNVKGKDTAARFGGEEFVVLLPETPLVGAQQLAERIRSTVERLTIRQTGKTEVTSKVTVSLGVACYNKGESQSEFIARADKALYISKEQGRNRVSLG